MAKSELLIAVSSLSKRVDILIQQKQELLERIKTLEEEIEKLKRQHLSDQEKLEKREKDIEFLSLSHRLANSPEALVEARRKIAMLIRTIDNCIRLIKED